MAIFFLIIPAASSVVNDSNTAITSSNKRLVGYSSCCTWRVRFGARLTR
jgi:hypothetical protein